MSATGNDRCRQACASAALTIAACAATACLLGCEPPSLQRNAFRLADEEDAAADVSPEAALRIEAFCGDCHALPLPESFARDRWHFEVRRGYEFYAKSGRNDLDPPPLSTTLAYYRARAPEQLTFTQGDEADGAPPVGFKKEQLHLDSGAGVLPEVAQLRWARLAANERPLLLASDMRYGYVVAIDLARENRAPPRTLAVLRNPGRLELCDLDANGGTDIIVADLGSYLPSDHDRGRVVWLTRRRGTDEYEAVELAAGLGRIADVRAADMNGDEKIDLVVAEFGWRDTGRLLLLRQISQPGGAPRFELEELDDRPGAINVRIHDFTGDGRPDIAALFSQEYECVDLFLNSGQSARAGTVPQRPPFVRRNLWAAPDLTFGSSGIELVDLNEDDLLDILFTNGDTFDNDYASPWHGVQWLENRGGLDFAYHRITDMPGAYCAAPADFDRDGDLDIVVAARLPPNLQPSNLQLSELSSIVLLRQTKPGVFERHTLERGSPYYPTVAVADFDGNGAVDFAVGSGPYIAEKRKALQESHYLTIWWNETAAP